MLNNRSSMSLEGSLAVSLEEIDSRHGFLIQGIARRNQEHRRTAGVYYTPGYVSEYIVRNALTPLLTEEYPQRITPIRTIDPACGAGSFLMATYRFLLQWHRSRLLEKGAEQWTHGVNAPLCRTPDGDWQLTLAERQRVLLDNVFGIDIDPRAVEAAKLALVLAMLDQSPDASIAAQTLHRLADNIQCSDALLGSSAKMAGGGFDVVLGNPPYRRERGSKVLLESLAATHFGNQYRSARMDLWYYFVHRGLELLQPGGVLSFIVSSYWIGSAGAERLVTALRDEAHLDEMFLLDDLPVFPGVAGRHMILRMTKTTSIGPTTIKRVPPRSDATAEEFLAGKQPSITFLKSAHQLFRGNRLDLEPEADGLLAKIERWPSLAELGSVRQGIAENPASINAKTNVAFGDRWRVGQGVFALRPAEVSVLALSDDEQTLMRPYYDLCDVARYGIADRPSLRLLYLTKETCPDIERYPRLKAHLEQFRPIMESRRETRRGSNRWWHLHWPREASLWESPKIICLQFARRPSSVSVCQSAYVPFSMNVFVPSESTRESLDYLCGLLNSRVVWKWFLHHAKRRGVGLEINGRVLARTPIRRIDFSRAEDRRCHDHVAELIRKMLVLQRQTAASSDSEKTELEATDREIDQLVYHLYGLTDEEIEQVERATH